MVIKYITQKRSIVPLVVFRIAFGAMMLISTIRFWWKGWIMDLYVKPSFYFPLFDWQWVKPLGSTGMHLLFAVMAISALFILLGLFYRIAIIAFFLSFTYVELIDVTNYLNHYYFISIVSFLLIFLPANRYFSLDVRRHPATECTHVPAWTIGVIRLQLGMVYFFAGLAKCNYDWLISALPMKIWLPAKSHLPIIGSHMYKTWVAYFFSWFGALYDLFIVFFLLNKRTRWAAYGVVVIFHMATAIFFPGIGMFPYVMMVSSLVFFNIEPSRGVQQNVYSFKPAVQQCLFGLLGIYFFIQVVLPVRFLFYHSHLFWSEEGYRFSWRVMLMEKSGNTFFYVKERATGKKYEVNNAAFLTPLQEKMMSTQPDMMVQYARYLKSVYTKRGIQQPEIYAEGYVALNGRPSTPYINPTMELSGQIIGWQPYTWIVPFTHNQ
jgi:hypothetical protein